MCNEPMTELSNPGASGSIFYITDDDEFIVKTVQHSEADFLQKLLPGYFMVSVGTVSLKQYVQNQALRIPVVWIFVYFTFVLEHNHISLSV